MNNSKFVVNYKLFVISCLLFIAHCSLFIAHCSLPPPSLQCVSVTDSGYVSLTWIPVMDSANCFHAYYLYRSSNSNGPFTKIDSTFNINQSTFTDKTANANNQVYYYYLKTISTCNLVYFSSPGDTLSSMLLSVTNPQNGTAVITWTSLHYPHLGSSSLTYDLFREFPKGNWHIIATPNSLLPTPYSYIDTIAACNSIINYRIQLVDSTGCTSVSSVRGALFQSLTPPDEPVVDSVSIDPLTKKTIIGWQPSASKDANEYIIYEYINGVYSPIDSVSGYNNTFYLNPKSSPYTGSESYSVSARDSCIHHGDRTPPQNTLFISADLNICNDDMTLSWNPYINMDSLEGYRLFYSVNNGPFSLLSTLTAPSHKSQPPTKFVHTNLLSSANYCYYVKAFDTLGHCTSTSNIICVLSIISMNPKFAYLRYATVVQDHAGGEHIDVRCIADSSVYISKYVFLRADSLNGAYVPVDSLIKTGLYDFTFSDMNVNPNKQSYFYKVEVFDSCGVLSVTSNVGCTIHLVGVPSSNLSISLKWNSYVQWDGQVSDYYVYRQLPSPVSILNSPFSIIANVPPGSPLDYIDDISKFTLDEGNFTYVVEALEEKGTIYGFKDSSRSNPVVIAQEPNFFIPNAFNPYGDVPTFAPVGIFTNPQEYYFAIFNRWGSMVFETTVPNTGWNGMVNGKLAPLGIYVYILKYKDFKGHSYSKNGSVALLR